MAQIEKNAINENPEMRKNARLDECCQISVKDLKAGIFHEAKMLNSSKNGMYFETDSILQLGTKIYIGIENSLDVSLADEFECKLAEIIRRKKLTKSFYNYGYGIKFISADNAKERRGGDQRKDIDSRKHPRKPYSKSLLCSANNKIMKSTSQNISISGIFLKAEDKIEIGQTIYLSLPSKTKKRINVKGEVVWSNHEGCGVKFLKKSMK